MKEKFNKTFSKSKFQKIFGCIHHAKVSYLWDKNINRLGFLIDLLYNNILFGCVFMKLQIYRCRIHI